VAGWVSEATNAYDDYYYRVLSHELPPLTHPARGLEVDLHHTLTPPVSRLKVDGGRLLAQAVPLADAPWPYSRCHVLAPTDMVLHSATHLLFNDELRGGLRDVYDMHRLCLHFAAAEPRFWTRLTERAWELGLERPLWYALTTLRRLLATPVPDSGMAELRNAAPNPALDALMARLIDRLLAPANPERLSAPATEWVLFVRSHWVRMPPGILFPHLARKWARGLRQTLRARLPIPQH